jgi:hypothetical protein
VPPGLIPPFPLYADASFPTGPEQASVGVQDGAPSSSQRLFGILGGDAVAREDFASATASFGSVSSPAGLPASAVTGLERLRSTIEGLTGGGTPAPIAAVADTLFSITGGDASVETVRDGRALRASASARVAGVSLLGGLFTIGAIESTMTMEWQDPASEPIVTSQTDVLDARLAGIPIRFTSEGFEVAGNLLPVPAEELINQLVGDLGGSFRIGVERSDENSAAVTALAFDFDGVLVPGIDGLPPIPLVTDERDIVHLALGAIAMNYTSAVETIPALPPPAPPAALPPTATAVELPPAAPAPAMDALPGLAAPTASGSVPSTPVSDSSVPARFTELVGAATSTRLAWMAGLLLPLAALWWIILAGARLGLFQTTPQTALPLAAPTTPGGNR